MGLSLSDARRVFHFLVPSPFVGLLLAIFVLFPFVFTAVGSGIQVGGTSLWKPLALLWGIAVGVVAMRQRHLFLRNLDFRVEGIVWGLAVFMLAAGPQRDLVIDPAKNVLFCLFFPFLFRFLQAATWIEMRALFVGLTGLLVLYMLLLVGQLFRYPYYPGANQHQFFLTGLDGFLSATLCLAYVRFSSEKAFLRRMTQLCLVVTACVMITNISITESRSVFLLSLWVMIVPAVLLWLPKSKSWNQIPRRLVLVGGLLIFLFPLLHLSGALGNFVHDVTFPLFQKIRTIESSTGREAAFRIWGGYVMDHGRLIGKAQGEMPLLKQMTIDYEKNLQPLHGMNSQEMKALSEKGQEAQKRFAVIHHDANVPQDVALTSSHHLWLDMAARSGFLYMGVVLAMYLFMLWISAVSLQKRVDARVWLACAGFIALWGFSSHLDDEHWLYHIPFLTFIFVPIAVLWSETRSKGKRHEA